MKFLILNTDYPDFLDWLYEQHPGLGQQPFEDQVRERMESLFGWADFYSSNLRKLGHEAYDIHANNAFMQRAWSREHGVATQDLVDEERSWREPVQRMRHWAARTPLRCLRHLFRPVLRCLDSQPAWYYDVLAAQIRHYRPDVLLCQALDGITSRFLREMKPFIRLLVGQHAAPLPEGEDFRCCDLIVSSLPNLVEHFRRAGLPAELHRLGFEAGILQRFGNEENRTSVSFVGTLSGHHRDRVRLLEHLCSRLTVEIWGQGVDSLPQGSLIRQKYRGTAWGRDMFAILHRSKIALNHHIGIAASYANNMRLYEATGMGALLLTDGKENLGEMFAPDKEVIAYHSPGECAELIEYYLEHDDERESIARAGQRRTLRDHTYEQRMRELVDIVQRYV